MKTIFIFTVLVLSAFAANAQTRRIAHRAHSGQNTERYLGNDGNYGDPGLPMKVRHKYDTLHLMVGKDSVVKVTDSIYFIEDTTWWHPDHSYQPPHDVREYGKICSRFTTR